MIRTFCIGILCGCALTACSRHEQPVSTNAPADANSAKAAESPDRSRVVGTAAAPPPGITAIAVLHPKTAGELPAAEETPVMDQVSQTFGPALLFVRTNVPAEFRNSDDTLHNVHVTHEETREPQFNVAIPTGEKYTYTFTREGFYHVGCDIHPAMSAEIFASRSPYVAVLAEDGSFELDDVPPGAYVLTVYSGRTQTTHDVEVKRGVTTVNAG